VAHRPEGALLLQPLTIPKGRSLPPVAIISPGARAATAAPAPSASDGSSLVTWSCGADGPTIALGNGARTADEVFAKIDLVDGPASWDLLGPGFWIAFPSGLTLATSSESRYFQLQLEPTTVKDAIIHFDSHAVPAEAVRFSPPGGLEEMLEIDEREVRTYTRTYELDGASWQTRMYLLPIARQATLTMSAQAPLEHADRMFDHADAMARSFVSMDEVSRA
jgi:hypothetical protein